MPIDSHRTYLQKHRYLPRQIQRPPSKRLGIVVVIPVFAEKHLLDTLDSVQACQPPHADVELIVVINHGIFASKEQKDCNEKCWQAIQSWQLKTNTFYQLHVIFARDLPQKHAGVGLARKIGMDEAIDRFQQAEREDGLLVCLDADTLVAPNYLLEIEGFFNSYPQLEACSICFEHPLQGNAYPASFYRAISYYELHLRYYIEALRFAGHPYAYHTIGSAMAVRTAAYEKKGGMNRRKAGEDFYFLMKFMPGDKLGELNSTCVYPSPRTSDRVPFGTGKAIQQYVEKQEASMKTYPWVAFEYLRIFIQQIPSWYEGKIDWSAIPAPLHPFLQKEGLEGRIIDIRGHVASKPNFIRRFYTWFDSLKVLRLLHALRDAGLDDQDLLTEAMYPIHLKKDSSKQDVKALLSWYRSHQRQSWAPNLSVF